MVHEYNAEISTSDSRRDCIDGLSELQEWVKRWSISKGWTSSDPAVPRRPVPELLCLMHSEVSEALEDFRAGRNPSEVHYSPCKLGSLEPGVCETTAKPEGIPTEMADLVIRVADFCNEYGIDLATEVHRKMCFNELRAHRHGNKKC